MTRKQVIEQASLIQKDVYTTKEMKCFVLGAEWADRTMIDKACDYLRNHIDKDLTIYHNDTWLKRDEFIKRLKKHLEE